jgi:hypothetical protein
MRNKVQLRALLTLVEGRAAPLLAISSFLWSLTSWGRNSSGRHELPKSHGHRISTGKMPNRDKARTQLLLILDLLYTDRPPPSHRLQPAAPPKKREGGAGRRKETLKVERAEGERKGGK